MARVSLDGGDRQSHFGRGLHIKSATRFLLGIGWPRVISRLFTSYPNPEGKYSLLLVKSLKNREA